MQLPVNHHVSVHMDPLTNEGPVPHLGERGVVQLGIQPDKGGRTITAPHGAVVQRAQQGEVVDLTDEKGGCDIALETVLEIKKEGLL